jgi:hypothetical protein
MNKVIICSIIIIIIIIYFLSKDKTEGYWDLTPYKYHWNIYKCYDSDCIKKKGYECYQYCDKITNEGARRNCRMRCLDESDIEFVNLRFNNYTFGSILPKLKDHALTNNKIQEFGSYKYN